MPDSTISNMEKSPFGGEARLKQTLSASHLNQLYLDKCGLDILRSLGNTMEVGLYECQITGYKFWRPAHIAGDEQFYAEVSKNWENYYREERWEYASASKLVKTGTRVLEIGCGRGFFLRSIENRVTNSLGLELNGNAIKEKVTNIELRSTQASELLNSHREYFDTICLFQVLEHIADPFKLLSDALLLLKPGGMLIISTPNQEYAPFAAMEDAFNLPPHHVGHFTTSTYSRLQSVLPIKLCSISKDIRSYTAPRTHQSPRFKAASKLLSLIAGVATSINFRLNREPGPNILVAYHKLPDDGRA